MGKREEKIHTKKWGMGKKGIQKGSERGCLKSLNRPETFIEKNGYWRTPENEGVLKVRGWQEKKK